jgi:hypothetical protein
MVELIVAILVLALLTLPTYFAARSRRPWIGRSAFWLQATLAAALFVFAVVGFVDFRAAATAANVRCGTPLLGDMLLGFVALAWLAMLTAAFAIGRAGRQRA